MFILREVGAFSSYIMPEEVTFEWGDDTEPKRLKTGCL